MATPYENERARIENDARLAREQARRVEYNQRQIEETQRRQVADAAAREKARHERFLETLRAPTSPAPTFTFVNQGARTAKGQETGTGTLGGGRSGSGGLGYLAVGLVVLAVIGSASLQGSGDSSVKYAPTPVNADFTTEAFLKRLETKGCNRSYKSYDACVGALQELKSGKYSVLNCEYNGGMKRYVWSPEAPPNVNRYQEFDRNTIYGVDHVGAKDCGSLKG